MTVLAHIGHWYHAVLYLVPVLIVAGGLWLAGRHLPDEDADGEPLEDADALDDGPRAA